jgi:hypothetical protein
MTESFNKRRHPILGNSTVDILLRHQASEPLLGNEYTRNNKRNVRDGVFYVVLSQAIQRGLAGWGTLQQGEARHRKYKMYKLGGGQAHDSSSDQAAIVA